MDYIKEILMVEQKCLVLKNYVLAYSFRRQDTAEAQMPIKTNHWKKVAVLLVMWFLNFCWLFCAMLREISMKNWCSEEKLTSLHIVSDIYVPDFLKL